MGPKPSFVLLTALTCAALSTPAQTQLLDAVTPAVSPPLLSGADSRGDAPAGVTIPPMTPVEIEILADINSKTAKIGAMFPIRLMAPIMIDGKLVVPADAAGEGEIIHAAKARAAGKAGELIIAARYVTWKGTRIPLRSFKFGRASGQSRTGEAFAVGALIAPPLALFIAGGEVDIKTGTIGHAKVASETIILPTL